MKTKQMLVVLLALVLVFSLCNVTTFAETYAGGTYTYVVGNYDFGPAVDKLILHFAGDVTSAVDKTLFDCNMSYSSFDFSTCQSVTVEEPRAQKAAYLCDEKGNAVEGSSSKHVAIEFKVSYSGFSAGDNASPFTYNSSTGFNTWTEGYEPFESITLAAGKTITIGGTTYDGINVTAHDSVVKLVPSTADWKKDTYTYTAKSITHNRAAWEDQALKNDSGKNALIIWLHGAGEGGDDVDIDLLGNNVTLLAGDNVQNCFRTETCAGAYVLAVQAPTMWMDIGSGQSDGSSSDSIYNDSLFAAIEDYVAKNSDVDKDKIILGGCSNGGYMTMNMLIRHPDYFAAAYPVCEAYSNTLLTDNDVNAIKNIPMWIVASQDDTTVDPTQFGVPLYQRLVKAGAPNVLFSYPATVSITDANVNDGAAVSYMGHWSWTYVLKNKTLKVCTYENDTLTPQAKDATVDGKVVNFWQYLASFVTEKIVKANVSFNLNYENAPAATKAEVIVGEKVAKPADPERAHFAFDGWFVDSACLTAVNFESAISADTTYYAKWTKIVREITFSGNYDGAPDAAKVSVDDGEKVAKPADPERAHFAFDGWFVDSACLTAVDFDSAISANATYYAKWTKIVREITFSGNYDGAPAATKVSVNDGEKVAKPADPQRAHYTFDGWFVDSACLTAVNFDSAISADATYYAKWTKIVREITFSGNYDGAPAATKVSVDDGAKVVKPADPQRAHYTFEGWFVDSACQNAVNFDNVISANATYYAKWTQITRKVTFNLNYDGAATPTEITVNDGQKATAPAEPTRKGYKFVGWSKTADGENFDFESEITSDVVLLAKWEKSSGCNSVVSLGVAASMLMLIVCAAFVTNKK